jgi:predicted nucleic acid-binding OB-fold protein
VKYIFSQKINFFLSLFFNLAKEKNQRLHSLKLQERLNFEMLKEQRESQEKKKAWKVL